MKLKLTILFVLLFSIVNAQTSFLKDAAAKFEKALVTKDTVVLKQLLHNDVTYGHSNAWVQTKREVINDLFNGKLNYTNIQSSDLKWKTEKDWATLRSTTKINYTMNSTPGELNLHVLQV